MKGGILNILFSDVLQGNVLFWRFFWAACDLEKIGLLQARGMRSNVPLGLKFVLLTIEKCALCVFTWLAFMNSTFVELFLATWSWFNTHIFGNCRCQMAFKQLNMKTQNIRVFEKDKRRSGLQLWHRVSLFLALKPQRKAHGRICDDLLHRLASFFFCLLCNNFQLS